MKSSVGLWRSPPPTGSNLMREFSTALMDASDTLTSSRVTQSSSPPRRRRLTVRWFASTLTLAVLVLVGGFLFLGSTNDLGFRHRDWIVIADFQNNTGESVFDRSLNNALAVGLQQSNHVNLFPKTRVAQTLARMVREDTGILTEALGREVALRENIGLLVVPSIDRIDETFVLALRVLDPASGDELLSLSEHAEGANGVLPALDQLARRFRRDLGESRFSISRQNMRLGAATTPSLEALEAWSEGDLHWGLRNYDLAMVLFQRAVELDSSFAMAHADLGGVFYFGEIGRTGIGILKRPSPSPIGSPSGSDSGSWRRSKTGSRITKELSRPTTFFSLVSLMTWMAGFALDTHRCAKDGLLTPCWPSSLWWQWMRRMLRRSSILPPASMA